MIKKIIVVLLSVVILVACLVVPASAGVQGDYGDGDVASYLPFNIIYYNLFEEDKPLYEFGVLSTVYNNSYGVQRRDTNFGSEDYRNHLAEFVIYRPWTSWRWTLNEPIIYTPNISYDSLWPELRTEQVRAYTFDDNAANENGGYLDCQWSGRIVFADGTTSDSLEDESFSSSFTRNLGWTESGYLYGSVTAASYDVSEVLNYFHQKYQDRGGIWYIDNITFTCVPMIYGYNESADSVAYPAILVSSTDSSSYVGYSFVRALSTTSKAALRAFDSPIVKVQYEKISSWFDWVGNALGGFFSAPLFTVPNPVNPELTIDLTIGGLFFTVLACFGVFMIFRAFAGG